jgi:hypothetical protein
MDSRTKWRMDDGREEIEDQFAEVFENLLSLRCLASRSAAWHSSPIDRDCALSQIWLFRVDYGISCSLFPVSFRFSIGQTRSFDSALAEDTCSRQILSWEAQCIGMCLDDVLRRWAIITSEETKIWFFLLMTSSQLVFSDMHLSSPCIHVHVQNLVLKLPDVTIQFLVLCEPNIAVRRRFKSLKKTSSNEIETFIIIFWKLWVPAA